MNCENHPDRESITNCVLCDKAICEDCTVTIAGEAYCKDCVNKVVTQSILEKAKSAKEEKTEKEEVSPEAKTSLKKEEATPSPQETMEEEFIPEVETIVPLKPEEIEEEANAPEQLIPKVEKAKENFETDFEYETEYVETYDEGGEEDYYYYETPEPQEEQYGFESEPIIINPTEEKTEDVSVPNKDTPDYDYTEFESEEEIREPKSDDYQEAPKENAPSSELEAKYERYLEDLYYDEPEVQEREEAQYEPQEPQRNIRREKAQRQAPYREEAPQREYRRRPQRERDEGQVYINEDYDDGLIIPAHSRQSPQQATESYEDLKRRIERNYAEEHPQEEKRGLLRRNRTSRKANSRYEDQNIDNIQEMHGFKEDLEDEDEGFSIIDILLTIILIILILGLILYVIYIFTLSGDYVSFTQALMGLYQDPMTFINNMFN